MRVYVCGPMRGVAEFNAPAFHHTAAALRALGHECFDPAARDEEIHGLDFFEGTTGDPTELLAKGFNLRKALGVDLSWIARNADAICALPGWRLSKGSLAEVALARALDLPVAYLGDFDDGGVNVEVDARDAFRGDHSWVPGLGLGTIVVPSVTAARATWKEMASESILEEADRLVSTDRQDDYGHPIDNFSQTGRIWGALLNIADIPAELVGLMMIGAKASRETNRPKRDNRTDIAGYVKCVDMVIDERAAREALL